MSTIDFPVEKAAGTSTTAPTLRWSRAIEWARVQNHDCRVYAQRPRSVAELLVDARRWQGRPFLISGERRMTFDEHEQAVGRVARLLQRHGVVAGDRVMLLAFNRREWVVAFWAIQTIGATAVLGNALWGTEESANAIALSRPALLVSDRAAPASGNASVSHLGMEEVGQAIDSDDRVPLELCPVSEDDIAIIMFSSGTTGQAKGVVMTHRSVVANIQNVLILTNRLPNEIDPSRPGTISLLTMPLFHLAGIQISFSTLLTGGALVLMEGRFEAEKALQLIEREKIRVWGGVPTMIARVISHPAFSDYDTSSLRSIPMGGAAISVELRGRIQQAFPAIKKRVGSLYGLTEAGGVLAAGSEADIASRPGCVGKPLPVVELRIDAPDATGAGEVMARTPTATNGYLGETSPMMDPDGWIRTGDLGYLDEDNRLYITGRSKDVIIRGGENIAAVHVEQCLMQHAAVLECAVVPLAHADLGEEVGAAIVVKAGMTVTIEQLQQHAAAHLGKFQIPSRWQLQRASLPLNASGKIQKKEIISTWEDGRLD